MSIKSNKKTIITFTIISILIFLIFVLSLNTGSAKLGFIDTFKTLIGLGNQKQDLVIFNLRLPRSLLSLLVGAGLALSGCILQTLTKNDLADPGIIGINAGAGLGVVIYLLFSGTTLVFSLPLFAIISAIITAFIIFGLALEKDGRTSSIRILLIGVAINALIMAINTFLIIKLDEDKYKFFASWQVGTIHSANYEQLMILFPILLILFIIVYAKAKKMNIMLLKDETIINLGLNINRERQQLLVLATMLAATCVSLSGNIIFIGLVAPHIARRLLGSQHEFLIPLSALVGALFVLGADTLTRTSLLANQVPVGIVISIIAAPYFLYLLLKK